MTDYLLPDGTKIKLGMEKYMAPEILFHPEIIGLEYPRKELFWLKVRFLAIH